MNSEPVSDKRKRGRPATMAKGSRDLFSNLFPDVSTTRGLQNKYYESHALSRLEAAWEPSFAWLWGLDPCAFDAIRTKIMVNGSDVRTRWGILRELGRMAGDDMFDAARAVCEMKPKTVRAGAAFVRHCRLISRPASVLSLTRQLARIVDEYSAAHPDVTLAQLRMGLLNVADILEERIGEQADDFDRRG